MSENKKYCPPRAVDNVDEPGFMSDVRGLRLESADSPIPPDQISVLIREKYPEIELLGVGTESVVIADNDDPNIAISFRHDERMRGVTDLDYLSKFHMHNVLHILYPQYFPQIYAASYRSGQTKRERVYTDSVLEKHREEQMGLMDIENVIEDMKEEIFKTSGIKVGLDSGSKDNIIYGKDKNPKYVDLVSNSSWFFKFDETKIAEYITKIGGRSEDEIRDLKWSLRRIQELGCIEYAVYNKCGVDDIPLEIWNKLNDKSKHRVKYVIEAQNKKRKSAA